MQRRPQKRALVLASTSPYRRELLQRLGLAFEVLAPQTDETPLPGEAPDALVARLAAAKSAAVAAMRPAAIVIGSDQVAVHAGRVVGKPGNAPRARQQLASFSGQRVEFLTAVSVQCREQGFRYDATVGTTAEFRQLTADEIRRYVDLDRPLDCAGGFKSEAAGSTLLRRLATDDPSAIVGLPLIAVAEGLRQAGLTLP
jgi:septum formation protein